MSFELTLEDFKKSRLTLILISVNIVCYIVVNLILGDDTLFKVAQINSSIKNNGEYYRLLSSVFFHADLQHIFMNMLALLFVGSYSELSYPNKYLFLINYLIAGLIGSLFTLLIMADNTFSLGASGAIAGLYGANLILMDRNTPMFKIYSLIFLISFVASSFAPGIGTWAHIFGLLSGVIFGYIIKWRKDKKIKENWK